MEHAVLLYRTPILKNPTMFNIICWVDGTIVSLTKHLMFQVLSALSPSQQPTVLFSIYQNNTWTIRRLVDETIDPETQHIILKIVQILILSHHKTTPNWL